MSHKPVSKFTATERLAIVKEIHSGLQLKQSMQAISENIRKNMPEVKEKHSLQSVIGIVSSWIPVLQYMASQIPNCTEDLLVQRFQAFERAGGRTRGNPHLKRHVRKPHEMGHYSSADSEDDYSSEDSEDVPLRTQTAVLPVEQPVRIQPPRAAVPLSDEQLAAHIDNAVRVDCAALRQEDGTVIHRSIEKQMVVMHKRLFLDFVMATDNSMSRVHNPKMYRLLLGQLPWQTELRWFQSVYKTWLGMVANSGLECPADTDGGKNFVVAASRNTTGFKEILLEWFKGEPKAVHAGVICGQQCVEEFFRETRSGRCVSIEQEVTNSVFTSYKDEIKRADWNSEKLKQDWQFVDTFRATMVWVAGIFWDKPEPALVKDYQTAKRSLDAAIVELFPPAKDSRKDDSRRDDRRTRYTKTPYSRPPMFNYPSNNYGYRRHDGGCERTHSNPYYNREPRRTIFYQL